MIDTNTKEYLKTIAKKGGLTTKEKYGTNHFKQLSKKGVKAKKEKKGRKNIIKK